MKRNKAILTLTVLGLFINSNLSAQEYKANVPEVLLTPDHATSTYLGDIDFIDGFPTDKTIEKAYHFLAFNSRTYGKALNIVL